MLINQDFHMIIRILNILIVQIFERKVAEHSFFAGKLFRALHYQENVKN